MSDFKDIDQAPYSAPAPQTATVSDEAVQVALDKWFGADHYEYKNACFDDMRLTLTAALSPAAPVQQTDYFGELVTKARSAAAKAIIKFPQPNYTLLKIAEEAGEVVRGGVHFSEGRLPWEEVEGEIVQLMAMLIRFVTEGDQINGIRPPHAPTRKGGE